MYLSKHTSAERPRGSDTSPSSDELRREKPAGPRSPATRDRAAYLTASLHLKLAAAAAAASFWVAVRLRSAGAERRFLSCCPALNSSHFFFFY